MKDNRLAATLREERGKGEIGRLRRGGRVPAVVYGHGDETRHVSLDAHDVERLLAHVAVENTLLELDIEGAGKFRTLIREIQRHPHRQEILHIDFYRVHAGETLSLEVPVHLVGSAAGVQEGGILQQALHEVAVRCLPDNIPEAIEVDVSAMIVGDSVHVVDLPLPEGVSLEIEGDRTVCSVTAPTVVALEEEAEEPVGVGGEVEPELVRRRAEEDELPPATEQGGHGSQE